MYCIGGVLLGCILAVLLAIVKIRLQRKEECLAREAKVRLLAWEHDEEEHLAASRLRLREMKARQKA